MARYSEEGNISDDSKSKEKEKGYVIGIEADENTPLIFGIGKPKTKIDYKNINQYGAKAESCCNLRIFALLTLLMASIFVGTYLVVNEGYKGKVRFTLDLVTRELWSQMFVPVQNMLEDFKVMHILVTHTGGDDCEEFNSCVDILRNMEKLRDGEDDLPYNFLISSDGQVYEVRGWNQGSGYSILPKQFSLVIGFIGNYTSIPPTDVQCVNARSLVTESRRRRKLHASYQVFGMRNVTTSSSDGEAILQCVSKWQRFDTLLHVL